ncbi:hypothetical protein [Fodinicola acaciae]|uniref:hypothetical protein n=1 Tax=Fodinicola acaciae TaxID=2681555 RepID=UPI0013D129DC|nr:hypothetical protein [Fodinicola acaciae]
MDHDEYGQFEPADHDLGDHGYDQFDAAGDDTHDGADDSGSHAEFAASDGTHDTADSGEFEPAYADHGSIDPYLGGDAVDTGEHDDFAPADAVHDGAGAHDDQGTFEVDDTSTPVGALTDVPYEVDDTGLGDFPPQLDLGIDAPADGGPWLDLNLLGEPSDGGSDHLDDGTSAYAGDIPDSPPSGLADLTAMDAGADSTSWPDLMASDDPAVRSLAHLWTPAA